MKINTLTLSNFRAFPGTEPRTFTLDGKNLLIYGENGSGKSSVFHALKTFFSLNQPNSIGEMCNVFSKDDHGHKITDHWIEVKFDDGTPGVFWRGSPVVTPATSDSRVYVAARQRGCLDYRSLLDTNYRHGDAEIDLFDIAVLILLGDFLTLTQEGNETTIKDLWDEVEDTRWRDNDRTRPDWHTKPVRHTIANLTKINQACQHFNSQFLVAKDKVNERVNPLLDALLDPNGDAGPGEKFHLDGLNFSGVYYDQGSRSFKGNELKPVSSLRGYPILLPQHFLNEARLSALGLAMYLAGRLACVPTGNTGLKLLVLDDVLIGIDLSNRLPLLDLLRERFADWQIVLLTHDRVWFEMARMHTQGGGKWNSVEIFDRVCAERNIPYPVIRKVNDKAAKGCLEDAKRFLSDPTGPYEAAAANYARSGFELTLKAFCEHYAVPVRYKQEAQKVSSEDYLKAVEKWLRENQKPFLDASLERVKMFRRVVLNQGSHSGPPNIARSEIEGAISAVEALLMLTEYKAGADPSSTDKATELANGATGEEWTASLGFVRATFAAKLREFCEKERIPIKFGDNSTRTLWTTVHAHHLVLFTGPIAGVPADIQTERAWFVEPMTPARLQTLTQAKLHVLIAILNRWP